jgi:hypothetical protein
VEGIATNNGLKYYLTNEYFSLSSITTPQKFHIFDLSSFLSNYLNGLAQGVSQAVTQHSFLFYPNPADDIITIESKALQANYYLLNTLGQTVISGKLNVNRTAINISELPAGMYFLRVGEGNGLGFKVMKR